MVFDWEYTEAEYQRVEAIHDKYETQLAKLYDERRRYAKDSAGYKQLTDSWNNMGAQMHAELNQAYTDIEQAHFDQLGGDLQRILEDAKRQVSLILKMHYDYMKTYDLVKAPDGTWQPRNSDPKIEKQTAAAMIRNGIYLHLQALKADKALRKELRDYYETYISESPYTYTDTHTSVAKPTDNNEVQAIFDCFVPHPKYGLPNDKLTRAMISTNPTLKTAGDQQALFWGVNQAGKTEPKPRSSYISISKSDGKIKTSERTTKDDEVTATAFGNLAMAAELAGMDGPYYFTIGELWREKNGILSSQESPTKKQEADLIQQINRLTDIKITITEGEGEGTTGVRDNYINAVFLWGPAKNGKRTAGYRIEHLPLIFSYNMGKGHIRLVDNALRDMTKSRLGRHTLEEGGREFLNYLLLQIKLMYTHERDNTKILYSTMYAETGIAPPEKRTALYEHKTEAAYQAKVRKYAKSDRDRIYTILDCWKTQGWIKDFTDKGKENRNGNKIVAVTIILNPANYEKKKEGDAAKT